MLFTVGGKSFSNNRHQQDVLPNLLNSIFFTTSNRIDLFSNICINILKNLVPQRKERTQENNNWLKELIALIQKGVI